MNPIQPGPGFLPAPPAERSLGERLNERLVRDPSGSYAKVVDQVLERASLATEDYFGLNAADLFAVDRTLFRTLAGGVENYRSGVPPLFLALANGQAAYVDLGPQRQGEADHLMRLFAGLPLATIEPIEIADPELNQVLSSLRDQSKAQEFPVFVDVDGRLGPPNTTESIAAKFIASLARGENSPLGGAKDNSDPKLYYQWLVTRVDSQYRRLDPWLFGSNQSLHRSLNDLKDNIRPPWSQPESQDAPFGQLSSNRKIQQAYRDYLTLCGDGHPPDWSTLSNIADVTVALDRSLVSGIQTYWMKMLASLSSQQRQSLLIPVARTWVKLQALSPEHSQFSLVSPPQAPELELLERGQTQVVKKRYDRSLAIGQALNHMLTGMGIEERRQALEQVLSEIRLHQDDFSAREQRLRQALGSDYRGLDVKGLLEGSSDLHSPGVQAALDQLKALSSSSEEGTSTKASEIARHHDLMRWLATHSSRFGDWNQLQVVKGLPASDYDHNPLVISEFYQAQAQQAVTPLPQGSQGSEVLGQPLPGREPVKVSVVLEGGGGRGFAYIEALRQIRQALRQSAGQVAIDEYVGNSAGAVTAGLLAAGYADDELSQVQKKLDFSRFYSDYLWLSGAVDPKVRGLNRTGLFSQETMYQALSQVLKDKCPVEGRPVLFRDLPYRLKVTSTLLNSDAPPELLQQFRLQPDGQMLFSNETTPNMDVAAAICCSAAVPGFFNAPQMQLYQGGQESHYRMQMIDGGLSDNFPISEASQEHPSFLLTLPVYHQAPNPQGGPLIDLATLNFDPAQLALIDAYNQQRYREFSPQLMPTIQAAAQQGYGRAVLGLNLSEISAQTAAIVQGPDREETLKLRQTASQMGLATLAPEAAVEILAGNRLSQARGFWEQHFLDALLDKGDHFDPPGILGRPAQYRPGSQETSGVPELLAGALGSAMVAPQYAQQRLFEKLS